MLREAGALEVHVRISSPPVKWPCFYGIDFATRAELIANGSTSRRSARSIGADSLGYISLDGLVGATEQPAEPAVPGLLRRRVPDRAARARAARQARAGGHRAGGRSGGRAARRRAPAPPTSPTRAGRSSSGVDRSTSAPVQLVRAAGVDIDAGERAVELMRAAVDADPAAGGGRRSRRVRRAVRRSRRAGGAGRCWPRAPTASAPRSRSPRRSASTTRSARTWSRWSSTTSSSAARSRCS